MTELRRLRLTLDRYATELILVGDRFEEGGRFVQREISGGMAHDWTWLDWDDAYNRLAEDWYRRFGLADPAA